MLIADHNNMAIQTKPILYNGFEVKDGVKIKSRIDKAFFTEIYELSNDSFFYLFLNLNPNEVIDRRGKYELIRVTVAAKEWIGVMVKNHSNQHLSLVIEELTTLRGFDNIAGMKELKQTLIAEVINPLRDPEKFKKFKVSIPNGILLYGPPGCGKTFIVRKLSEELGYNFFEVKHSDLATPFIHGSVGNIGKVFEMAKMNAPAIVFFDEISGLVPDRQNLHDSSSHKEEEINEFLIQLNDAADNNILVVGATNYINRIDQAILRPGRMDKKIHVPPPDKEARHELFKLGLSGRPHDKDIDFDKLTELTDGYSAADIIEGIVEGSARLAANLDKQSIDQELLEQEIKKVKPVEEERPKIGFSI
ncbi:MAG: ATP-binding protein [Candidatus Pacebacteria bacterium]|nr:ATP-binding protein [Candidatus Paceibacterota bacterium]